MQQKNLNPQLSSQLKAFAEQRSLEYIVVAVDFDAPDQRLSNQAMQTFNSAITSVLKNNTYLETKEGKRLFLSEYRAPIKDGLGAKFIFLRLREGEPFLTPESNFLRFYAEVSSGIKLNMRFRVLEMNYDGNLEY